MRGEAARPEAAIALLEACHAAVLMSLTPALRALVLQIRSAFFQHAINV